MENNKKISYTQSYQEAVKNTYTLLHTLMEDKSIAPIIKWHDGWCEVSFTLNINKKNFEEFEEEEYNEKVVLERD